MPTKTQPPRCSVCDAALVFTTVFAKPIMRRRHPRGAWLCPKDGVPWHTQAEGLQLEQARTISPSLKRLIASDLQALLEIHAPSTQQPARAGSS